MDIEDDDKNKNTMDDDEYSENEGEQIRVSLVLAPGIQDDTIRIPSEPIAVPADVRRKGLSAVVNHLLDRKVPKDKDDDDDDEDDSSDEDEDDEEKLPAIPFDFLVNDRLLRTGVEAAARREGLSLENAVVVQYFPARKAPEGTDESETLPDWISAMSYEKNSESGVDGGMLFTGVCDGSVSAYRCSKEGGLKSISTVSAHTGPIKCLSSMTIPSSVSASHLIATGSMDQTLVTHTLQSKSKSDDEMKKKLTLHAVYGGGHFNSIGSVALLRKSDGEAIMASGDWDGGLCFWKIPSLSGGGDGGMNVDNVDAGKKKQKSKKKRRTVEEPVEESDDEAAISVVEVQPFSTIRAHNSNLSGLSFGYNSSGNTLLTGSWDHSVKVWDIEKSDCILTLNGARVVTSLGRCHNSDVVATGHPDCTVRLWDMRTGMNASNSKQSSTQVSDSILKPSHKSWVSAVEWSPTDPYVLASTSHDGTVKMWDIRSSLPLHTIRAQPKGQKGLCLAYGEGAIYSGGSDCIVRKFAC